MAIDEDLKKAVLEHADIVKIISAYQSVIKKGNGYVAICPFHNDTDPSLQISPKKQIFRCFACGTGGNAVTYVLKREGCTYFEALKKVAEISGYSDPRLENKSFIKKVDSKLEPLYKCLEDLNLYYQYQLNIDEGKVCLDYLKSRKIDNKTILKYKLGYAPENGKATIAFLQSKGHSLKTIEDAGISSVVGGFLTDKNRGRMIVPLFDKDGRVIGFSARTLKNEDAKYVNTQETPLFHKSNILYNLHNAKSTCHIDKYIYVMEGYMDIFALGNIGIDSAVALMGTALTDEHINILRGLNVEIRLCLDNDDAGQNAMKKISSLFTKAGLTNFKIVKKLDLNDAKDADDILKNHGEDVLKKYLNTLQDRVDFALNYYKDTKPLTSLSEKELLVKQFIPILLSINSVLEQDVYIRKLADVTGFEQDSIRRLLMNSKKEVNVNERREVINNFHPEDKILRKLKFAERELLFQMTNNKEAIIFYENNVSSFYEDNYRLIANYLVEYASNHDSVDTNDIINYISESDDVKRDDLINELSSLEFEQNHPIVDKDKLPILLNDILKSIKSEKEKIVSNDNLKASFSGKTSLEKARILDDYNNRKHKKS